MLVAYHGDASIKAKYMARVAAHREADEIIQGNYWVAGRGCGVGCTIHGSDHFRYETALGIPVGLARLEDAIFEGLPLSEAKSFPGNFLDAIEPGSDLSLVESRFMMWLLTSDEIGLPRIADDRGKVAIAVVAGLWQRRAEGDDPSSMEWAAARDAAGDAAGAAAWAAAGDAAWDAAWAAAGDAAGAAARDAAWAAARAAARDAARDAAWAAAWDAAWAAAWDAARDAAWAAAWRAMSAKLLELLRSAPIPNPA